MGGGRRGRGFVLYFFKGNFFFLFFFFFSFVRLETPVSSMKMAVHRRSPRLP